MANEITFGQWVKQRRKALGLTQQNLASVIACSKETINKVEGDRRRPSLQIAHLLARHLQIPTTDYEQFLHLARPELTADQIDIFVSAYLPTASSPQTSHQVSRTVPIPTTPFIGREQEITAVMDLLHRTDVRLITITGPGGAGKTRLCLQVAANLQGTFANGVYFVPLSPISEPDLVLAAIMQTLGIKDPANQSIRECLLSYLNHKELLLVLDNFEQALAAAREIALLLAMAPGLKILVTSRTRLHLSGEHEFVLSPLRLPDLKGSITVKELVQFPAVSLFVQRAQAIKADFTLTAENAPIIAEICTRLDGLPLAIELAAAHIKFVTPEALLAQWVQETRAAPLDMLTDGAIDLPPRHQEMRQTIAWSYNLLTEAEKSLFRRLGVFVDGCTLEAVTAVVGALEADKSGTQTSHSWSQRIRTGLISLINKSLLSQVTGSDGNPRFVMLALLREYALEQLDIQGELETVRRRQANFFLALAEAAQRKSEGSEQSTWLNQLEDEHDNLRAVLQWSCTAADRTELGLRLAGALWDFWLVRGYVREGRDWLARLLAQPETAVSTTIRAEVLNGAGLLAWTQGDSSQATAFLEESLSLFKQLGNKLGCAWALGHLGDVALTQGNFSRAVAVCEASLAIFRKAGKPTNGAWILLTLGNAVWAQGDVAQAIDIINEGLNLFQLAGDRQGAAWATMYLGFIAYAQGNHTQAIAQVLQSRQVSGEIGDKTGDAWALNFLGRIKQTQGEYEQALSFFGESLRLFYELGIIRGIAWCLVGLARVACTKNHIDHAAYLFAAAEGLLAIRCENLAPVDRHYYEETRAAIQKQQTPNRAATLKASEKSVSGKQAVTYALDYVLESILC